MTVNLWVLRAAFVLLAGLLSAGWVRAADAYWVYAQSSAYAPGLNQQIGGVTAPAACGNAGYVRWGSNADVRVYTAYQASPLACLLYSDAGHVSYVGTWSINGDGWGPTTSTLQFWDGWCNSLSSCAAQGWVSSGGGSGGTSTVVVTVEPAPASTQNIDDYNTLYAAFLAGIVSIYLVKRLGALWSSDHERG